MTGLALGYKQRLPSINFILGLLFTVMAGLAFIVSGFFYSENVLIGDICEQSKEILDINKIPLYGYEMSYYFSCMSSVFPLFPPVILSQLKLILEQKNLKSWKNLTKQWRSTTKFLLIIMQNEQRKTFLLLKLF